MAIQNYHTDARLEAEICDEAFELMERALVLLDRAGLQSAAIHLDHAICLVPNADGKTPRIRLTDAPTI